MCHCYTLSFVHLKCSSTGIPRRLFSSVIIALLDCSLQIRGATNAIKKLQEERGQDVAGTGEEDGLRVVTHSSGNHAQALALAARNCGIPAEIVMPNNSPAVKMRAVREYGGRVTLCHPSEQVRRVVGLFKLLGLSNNVKESLLLPHMAMAALPT